jgi:T4 RnlA family RNA ligase
LHRLASYTDFLEPNALEGRGVMFEMDNEGKDALPIRLASLPFSKFFNHNENPFTMDPDWSSVVAVEDKMDGSLMSTYLHFPSALEGTVMLKSKGSTQSPQCQDAVAWLSLEENEDFREDLLNAVHNRWTVIMEWTSPNNRIVLGYDKPGLTVLAVRANYNGEYITRDEFVNWNEMQERWVADYMPYVEKEYGDVENFVDSIIDKENIEGYVLTLESGQRIKLKTQWYLTRHRTKDSVNCPRRLFEAVLDEATDDLRTLFFDDPTALKMINDMEKFAEGLYNHLVDQVERFYERNKHMERKEYAILGQKELTRPEFGLAMMKYTGKSVDYKASLKKRWRDLGLKDEVQLEEGEE